ncbi:unnamed protein product, partial [Aphanomyces euteiches]
EDPTSNRRDVDDQLPHDAPIRDNLVPRIANENDDDDILDDILEPPNENETIFFTALAIELLAPAGPRTAVKLPS